MSTDVYLGTVISVCVAFLGAMRTTALVLGQRIADVGRRTDRLVNRFEERFASVEARLEGIADTLVRFDERLRHLEERA